VRRGESLRDGILRHRGSHGACQQAADPPALSLRLAAEELQFSYRVAQGQPGNRPPAPRWLRQPSRPVVWAASDGGLLVTYGIVALFPARAGQGSRP
jgi:hypothetical protein